MPSDTTETEVEHLRRLLGETRRYLDRLVRQAGEVATIWPSTHAGVPTCRYCGAEAVHVVDHGDGETITHDDACAWHAALLYLGADEDPHA